MSALRCVVTGAASGMGAAIAEGLRRRGDRVVGLDLSPATDTLIVDLADGDARTRVAEEARARLGGVDVLINAAGIYRPGSVVDSVPDDWRPVWEVDLVAPVDLMRLLAPDMIAAGRGWIVNITSVHGRISEPDSLAYDIAKAGLEAATRSAAVDLGEHGILVNAIAPGFVRTPMGRRPDGSDETDTPEFRAKFFDDGRLPLRRGARAEEIVPAVLSLASVENTYLTGQVVVIDGGLTARF
ncbi:MAG: SDR family oxidoreductase [Microbacterium sp.]|nr:SDR family oxidoreductase [Microbacterium sp.]